MISCKIAKILHKTVQNFKNNPYNYKKLEKIFCGVDHLGTSEMRSHTNFQH